MRAAIQKLLQRIRPGLRAKLALFIGITLAILISALLTVAIEQQVAVLSSRLQREISRFRKPVEVLTLEIDHHAESLIRLERFAARVKQRQAATTKSAGGDPQEAYFDEAYVSAAAEALRLGIELPGTGGALEEPTFAQMRKTAALLAVATVRSKRRALDLQLRNRLNYEGRATTAFQGLDLKKYRFQVVDWFLRVPFDTAQILPESGNTVEPVYNVELRKGQLDERLRALVNTAWKKKNPQYESAPFAYQQGDEQILVKMQILFRDPAVSERARLVLDALRTRSDHTTLWRNVAILDRQAIARLRTLSEPLGTGQKVLAALAKEAPAQLDELHARHNAIVKERRSAIEEIASRAPLRDPQTIRLENRIRQVKGELESLKQAREQRSASDKSNSGKPTSGKAVSGKDNTGKVAAGKNESGKRTKAEADRLAAIIAAENKKIAALSTQLLQLERRRKLDRLAGVRRTTDAFVYLRDAALLQKCSIPLHFRPAAYARYLNSAVMREKAKQRFEALRSWAGSRGGELPDRTLSNSLRSYAILVCSRSEARELMWQIDSTDPELLARQLLTDNTAAFLRVFMDQSQSAALVRRERTRLLDTALSLSIRILVVSFLLVGVITAAIRRIVAGADRLGQGQLDVEFTYSGRDELGLLVHSLNRMVTGLKERAELRGELSAAEEIQKRLLPEVWPANMEDAVSFGAFYKAMSGVGGDYYDCIACGKNEFLFCIADVSSHGAGPAIIMTMMRSQLRAIAKRGERDPLRILAELNEPVYLEAPPHIFITIFLGIYNRQTNSVHYCNAGHNPALLFDYRAGTISKTGRGGMPLGAVDNDLFLSTQKPQHLKLAPGDLFFQYTDGLNEAMNSNREQFGMARLESLVVRLGKKKPALIVEHVARQVERFSGRTIFCDGPSELNDDIAMLAFRRLK